MKAKKLKGYSTLKNKLDKVFSEWTRRRFSAPSLQAQCVSCRQVRHWRELQCGHFVSRVRLATRWDPDNCAPQCGKCNVLLRGNAVGYARWLENRYGHSIFADLDERSRRPVKFSRSDLQEAIDLYTAKLKDLPNV